jgi:2-dehydropantoate 2-reductase
VNILIVGPGAMGCLFAARLAKAGVDVRVLDYKKERAQRINENGIRVEGVTGEYLVNVPIVIGRTPGDPDVVLICVKSNQTQAAVSELIPLLGKEATVLTLQNGLGNVEILEKAFGKERVLCGVTSEGATLLAPGHIRHAGQGETTIGPEKASNDVIPHIVSAFNSAGFKTYSAANVEGLIWGKLVINVGINALTAITRLKNGRLGELEGTKRIMEAAVKEAAAVAQANNIDLPYPDPFNRVLEVCAATSGNIASMLQDVLKHKLTEVEFINGAIVKIGESSGVSTPVNRVLTCLVQTIQETYGEQLKDG